jgi:hypothetical protein
LCCGARRLSAPTTFLPADATLEWDLAVTAIDALASVLPDVPVPLLGNRTPRDLYGAGAEEQAAAVRYVTAVGASAESMGVAFPTGEVLTALNDPTAPAYDAEERRKLTLARFTLHLLARGVEPAAVVGAHRLYRDLGRLASLEEGNGATDAAAVDYAICWMTFRPEADDEHPEAQREVAALYGVAPQVVLERFAAMKQALKLVWFDPRYIVPDAAWQRRLEETARAIAEGDDDPPDTEG